MKDNYFEKKLEITKDSLAWTIQELKAVGNRMLRSQLVFDDNIKKANLTITKLESIREKALKDIKHYESVISKGYKFVDMRNGKAYKSEASLNKQILSEKSPKVKPPEDEEAIKRKAKDIELSMENKKQERARLKQDRKVRQEAERTLELARREKLRIAEEAIKLIALEKEKARKEQEAIVKIEEEQRQRELAKSQEKMRLAIEEEAKILRKAAEKAKIEADNSVMFKAEHYADHGLSLEDVAEMELKAMYTDGTNPAVELGVLDPRLEITEAENIAEKREIADQFRTMAKEMNGETDEIEWLAKFHGDWQEQFEVEQGGKAIWQGRITNGFKQWCTKKGYKIGG